MFSCDVVAFETQSAPLWEEVNKPESTSKRRETGDENLSKTSTKVSLKRPSSPTWQSQQRPKQRKMQEQYTECKLCELNFNNELELEEHLFSILHHRSLDTELGPCRHLCNLCGIGCNNLAEYVNHLKNAKHKSKYIQRKAEVEVGTYKKPLHGLERYKSDFMLPPTRSKQKKLQEDVNKKVNKVFSKRALPQNSTPQDDATAQDKFYDKPRRPYHNTRRQYPDWHPMGHYGGRQSPQWNQYHNYDYDMSGQGQCNWYGGYGNPYEQGNWFPGPRAAHNGIRPRTQDLEHSVYRQPAWDSQWQNRDVRKGNSRPVTPTSNQLAGGVRQGGRSLTNNQSRTKELVARAHQVIKTGKNITNKPKTNKKSKNGAKASQRSLNVAEEKEKSNARSARAQLTETSVANKCGGVTQRPKKNSHDLKGNAAVTSSSDNTATANQSSSLLSSSGSSSTNLPSSALNPRILLEKADGNMNARLKPAATSLPRSRTVHDKFRDQLSKKLGPARMKKTPQRKTVKPKVPESSNKPGSTDDIREQFRKIMDDIEQPVMSASEVILSAKRKESSTGASEISLTTSVSWAESRQVSGTNSEIFDSTSTTVGEQTSRNLANNEESGSSTLTGAMTLRSASCGSTVSRHSSQDRTAALQRSISAGSDKNVNTPTRSEASLSSDSATPNKKRQNPRPNLKNARSRMTFKQKDSPGTPNEIRHAKLKRLLQNYDRIKKNSPETTEINKNTPGPRFGIELNLRSRPMNIQDLLKQGDLVEVEEMHMLPPKHVRSLSESDSMLSFTSAASESTINSSVLINQLDMNSHKPDTRIAEKQQQQTNLSATINQPEPGQDEIVDSPTVEIQQQKTSTPTMPPPSNPRSLNEKLLRMSEREESLHLSVRSLSLEEENVQSEIDNRIAMVKEISEQLEKLNEKKLCVEALKRRHEEELNKLRLDRLAILRGSVSGSHFTINGSPPQLQRMENHALTTAPQVTDKNSKASNPVLSDFDLSKVKSEPTSAEDPTNLFPRATDEAASGKRTGAQCGNIREPLNANLVGSSDSIHNESSAEFYSFENESALTDIAPKTSEVDRIVAKYSKPPMSSKEQDGRSSLSLAKAQKRKRESLTRRQSPRLLEKDKVHEQNTSAPPICNVSQTVIFDVPEESNAPNQEDVKALPKFFKAHDLPLVGLHLMKDCLVTCSQDETMALHTPSGKKHTLSLGATPTAMTVVSEDAANFVFIATQKLISKTQGSDNSVVINRLEHWLDVYTVQECKNGVTRNVFELFNRLKLEARALCLHYDKKTLFCGMRDGMAAILSLDSHYQPKQGIDVLECHSSSAITCLTTGMEGTRRILCCGSTDCTVSVRDAIEGLLLRTIQGHTKTVTCLQLVHNELYSGSVDRLVLRHNLNTGNLLSRFSGHAGIVRSLHILSNTMVTLCSDKNIRFYDTKTSRLIQKPKTLSSPPLFACVPALKTRIPAASDKIVYIGCEDSTVIRVSFPHIQPIRSCPARNLNLTLPTRSKQRSPDAPTQTADLSGKFQCQWSDCEGAGTFGTVEDLGNHVFSTHIDTSELTPIGDHTLRIGTCCHWDSCTHYFAPELDTVRDITVHMQRHFDNLKRSP